MTVHVRRLILLGAITVLGVKTPGVITPGVITPGVLRRSRRRHSRCRTGRLRPAWQVAGGRLRTQRWGPLNYVGGALPVGEPFVIVLSGGKTIAASEMTITGTPRVQALAAIPNAPRLADREAGQQAVVMLTSPEIPGPVTWRAVLRQSSRLHSPGSHDRTRHGRPVDREHPAGVHQMASRARRRHRPGFAGRLGQLRPSLLRRRASDVHLRRQRKRRDVCAGADGADSERTVVRRVVGGGHRRRPASFAAASTRISSASACIRTGRSCTTTAGTTSGTSRPTTRRTPSTSSTRSAGNWSSSAASPSVRSCSTTGGTVTRRCGSSTTDSRTGSRRVRAAAEKYGAEPGVWMSPFGGYGAPRTERLTYGKQEGFETNERGFALSGPDLLQAFPRHVRRDDPEVRHQPVQVRRHRPRDRRRGREASSAATSRRRFISSATSCARSSPTSSSISRPARGRRRSGCAMRTRSGVAARTTASRASAPGGSSGSRIATARHVQERRPGRAAVSAQLADAARPHLRARRAESQHRSRQRLHG